MDDLVMRPVTDVVTNAPSDYVAIAAAIGNVAQRARSGELTEREQLDMVQALTSRLGVPPPGTARSLARVAAQAQRREVLVRLADIVLHVRPEHRLRQTLGLRSNAKRDDIVRALADVLGAGQS